MRPARGVRSRLTVSTAVNTAGAMAVMLLLVLLAANRLMASQVETSLEDRVTSVEASLQADQDRIVVPSSNDDAVLDGVWIFDADGTEVSGPTAGPRTTAVLRGLATVGTTTTVQRGERIFLARPVTVPGDTPLRGVAVASESLDVYEGSRNILLGALGVVALLVVASTAATTAWTVSRTLRPVAAMTDAADEWSAHDLEPRFAPTGDDEFARLGRTLDRLLDRVAQAIRAEQQLTSELAHELRTPLTAIRGEAELALLTDPDSASRERFERVLEQVDRVSATITALLELARHASLPDRRADVGEVVAGLVSARPRTDVAIDVAAAAGLHAAASPELVERIVAPVVDNAVRHAATRVEVVVRHEDRRILVTVADDGPGLDSAHVEDVFVAGFRQVDDPDGAGLGLALSRRVAGSIGGSVAVTSTRTPTVFTIMVPEAT